MKKPLNKKIVGLGQVALVIILCGFFYVPNSPGFFLLVLLAALFWRDPFMEMITGRQALDATIFGVRSGQIIYNSLMGIYFIGTIILLVFILWKAKNNIFSKE